MPDGPRNMDWTEKRAAFTLCFGRFDLLWFTFILLNVHRHAGSSRVPFRIYTKFIWIKMVESKS